MSAASRHAIEAAFQITGGPQIVLTSISARGPSPCMAGDQIVIQSPSGRIEHVMVGAIEYALKPGGAEFYVLALGGGEISGFGDFTGGVFETESR